jgi:hypothetical protein
MGDGWIFEPGAGPGRMHRWPRAPMAGCQGDMLCSWLFLALFPVDPPGQMAAQAPELDRIFQLTDGWIGGDGVYSVELAPKRTLWLFSDTWVGKIRDGKRTDAKIVNNTLAITEGTAGGRQVSFFVRRDGAGQPVAFFTPPDPKTWFWLQAGLVVDRRLYIFAAQITRTGDGVFGFRQVGQWLIIVDNPSDSPWKWRIRQVRLANVSFEKPRQLSWGSAALAAGDEIIIYGFEESRTGSSLQRSLICARVKARTIEDDSTWQYFGKGNWHSDLGQAEALVPQMATEFSVHFLATTQRYHLVYTENGLSARVMMRTSEQPAGPWSEARIIYECPEMKQDKNFFSYAAKAHPSLSGRNELVISYVVNSRDFWQVARESSLYWPRFIRLPLTSTP